MKTPREEVLEEVQSMRDALVRSRPDWNPDLLSNYARALLTARGDDDRPSSWLQAAALLLAALEAHRLKEILKRKP